jgi:nucleotide-binding universal stress UspA family protein
MKKFLVPTDFSETAKNAARYAVELAANDPDALIILYNVFDKLATGSDGSVLTETDDDRKKILNSALAQLEIELHEIANVRIQYVAEEGRSLVENVERYIRHNGIDIVIMGITGSTKLEQIFIGSNALNMAREGVCPVIIVPPNARFSKIKNVLLASDFKNVKGTTPVAQIQMVLDIFIRMFDFLDAISNFTADHQIDLIVTVPRKHSFLRGLYKTSHTKKLAYHSHVPVMAIHE